MFSDKPGKDKKAKRQKEPKQNKAVEAKKPNGGRKALIASGIVVGVLVAAFLVIGAYANGLETIYPNVSMQGTPLGGMTIEEAAEELSKTSLGDSEDKELTVSLPAGEELIVSAKEAGCYLSAPDAAIFVYERCHNGGFFTNTITYFRCAFGKLELNMGDGAQLNEEYLASKVSEAAKKVQVALLDADIDIGEDSVTIIKGASSAQIDADDLLKTVKAALLESNFEPITYDAVTTGDAVVEIDLQKLYDTVFEEPVNAVYDKEKKAVAESVNGRSLDMDNAKRLWDEAELGDKVVLPLIITEPEVTTEKLNSMLFADLLSQKSTGLGGSSAARINNISKAASAINGLILNPGEEFSYNGTVGQRTAAAGYQGAGAYLNGKVVTEIGGGICQVSSTLYYCTLIANLEITERYCHYFGVSYLPAGLDATVSWPAPDFKFKNNSDYPIKIEAFTDMSAYNVTVRIYGSNPDGIRVEMTTDTWQTSDGYGAVSYRWVYDRDGNLISKTEESRSQYHYHAKEEDPTPSPSASPTTEPSPSPSQKPETPPVTTEPVTTPPVTPPPETTPPVVTTPPPVDTPPQTSPPDPTVPVDGE